MKLLVRCWWLSLAVLAACFSPQFQDGQIMCGPSGECPPGLDCFGGVCRAADPGVDASTAFPVTVVLGGNSMGTVTSAPSGITCGSDCTETFASGTMVTLTATPMSGSTFVGWSGACSGTGSCTITVATAITVTANFAVDSSLLVALEGTGSGVVSSNPAGINCGIDCMEQFAPNTVVVLTASAATGSTFDGWEGAGCTGTGTCMVTADAAKMVTASFSLTQHSVTVTAAGTGSGTVSSTPTGIDCGTATDCSESYPYGTMVTLSATPATGSTFTGWSGGACTGIGTCQVTMTQAVSVIATFTLTTHALTITKAGNGAGTVTSSPLGINCGSGAGCTSSFNYNTMVTLSATPTSGSTFTGWSGGGCSGTASCVVTLTQATAVTATFVLNTYPVGVLKDGNGNGTVSSNLTGINCGTDCSESYNFGTTVTLTAVAATGSTFTGWSGGGCTSGSTAPCTVTVANATTVTATFTLTTHNLTVSRDGTGTGSISGVGINCGSDCDHTYDYGASVTLIASAAAGSTFAGWSGAGCSGTGTCEVTMTQARSVTATFTLTTHLVSVTPAGTGAGTVTSNDNPVGITCGSDCNEVYGYGTSVTLTATPRAGSVFSGWSGGVCSGAATTCTFTVDQAKSVTATFTITSHTLTIAKSGAAGTVTSNVGGINCGTTCSQSYVYNTSVTLTAVAGSGNTFSGWSGGGCTGTGTCTVTMDTAKTVTATFVVGTAGLTVTKSGTGSGTVTSNDTPAGINCGTDCSHNYNNGSTVVLTAAPAAGSVFTSWSGGPCNGSTMTTCSITFSGTPVSVTATFTLTLHSLTINRNGTGTGTVTSNDVPQTINCGTDCGETYPYGTSITLSATPAANATFVGWTGGGCSGTGTCTVSITAATSVTARFDLIQRLLRAKVSDGGTITSMPAGINCGADCDASYNDGQVVMLLATADPGYSFVGWSGDCSGASTMCSVTMDQDKGVVAEFTPVLYTLSVLRNDANGGDVYSINDTTIDCGLDCTEDYSYGTVVSLKPSPASGYTFTGWSGACTGNGDCDITMDMAKSVTANFVVTTYAMTVNLAGSGTGVVTSNPAGINCGGSPSDCSQTYNEGTIVTLTATPSTGTNFTSWSGCTSSSGNTCSVTMNAAKSVTATFTVQQFSLNLTKLGTGAGGVVSTPSAINCGPTCSSASTSFAYNTNVALAATPAPGSTFTSWSGCASVSGTTCNVTMTQARNVSVTFTTIPPNYVFVTSTTHNGMLGGLTGADQICQMRAAAASLPGTYRAWLSTSTVNAVSRLGSARGWIRTDGRPFADQISDITSGHLFYPAVLDENGTNVGDASVRTATSGNGMRFSSGGTCSDWTSTTGSPASGIASNHSTGWTQFSSVSCNATSRLYCFGVDNAAVVAPPVVSARRAFVSSVWTPGGGLTSADAQCAADATAAGLPGTFKALLATSTASAISRFNTAAGTLPWARPDGTLITTTAAAMASASLTHVLATPNSNAANTVWYSSNPYTWTGADTLTGLGTQTCSDWTSNAAASVARAGWNGHTNIGNWRGGYANIGCDQTSFALVCLQQ